MDEELKNPENWEHVSLKDKENLVNSSLSKFSKITLKMKN
jgi:hypothetical protein